jgi:uncharacterized protein (TIGR00251 family)
MPIPSMPNEARIQVRVTPRASRDAVGAWRNGVLAVLVVAPPVDGKANAALERLLARTLAVPRTSVAVIAGQRSRDKTVLIAGLSPDEALRRLGCLTL